jgi:hypothetical protein
VAEGARLESVYTFTGIGGSNPSLSASIFAYAPYCFRMPIRRRARGESRISCCSAAHQLLQLFRVTGTLQRDL